MKNKKEINCDMTFQRYQEYTSLYPFKILKELDLIVDTKCHKQYFEENAQFISYNKFRSGMFIIQQQIQRLEYIKEQRHHYNQLLEKKNKRCGAKFDPKLDRELQKFEVSEPEIDVKAKLANELKATLSRSDHPIRELLFKLQEEIIRQIDHFNQRVINFD